MQALRAAAPACRGCELWEPATQVVFSAGNPAARVALVGREPGDVEDREGNPFVGPAGRLLQRAVDEAGIDRGASTYVDQRRRDFRFTPRGNRRIHSTPRLGAHHRLPAVAGRATALVYRRRRRAWRDSPEFGCSATTSGYPAPRRGARARDQPRSAPGRAHRAPLVGAAGPHDQRDRGVRRAGRGLPDRAGACSPPRAEEPSCRRCSGCCRSCSRWSSSPLGLLKVTRSRERLLAVAPWVEDYPQPVVTSIGVLELLGAAGVVLPCRRRHGVVLVPVAATGLAILMLAASSRTCCATRTSRRPHRPCCCSPRWRSRSALRPLAPVRLHRRRIGGHPEVRELCGTRSATTPTPWCGRGRTGVPDRPASAPPRGGRCRPRPRARAATPTAAGPRPGPRSGEPYWRSPG